MYKVLIVDDDRWALSDIKASFQFEKHRMEVVGECTSAESAIPLIFQHQPDLIVTDICMGAESGLDIARICQENQLHALVILVSGFDRFDYAQEALKHGVFAYLLKPLEDDSVAEVLQRVQLKLASHPEKAPVYTDDSLGRAMQYIRQHFTRSLPLDEVASSLFLNKNYLSELFSRRLGMTFTQYKNALRISLAKEMFAQGATSVTDVALSCGFETANRFSKVFRQFEGKSPQQYKRELEQQRTKTQ